MVSGILIVLGMIYAATGIVFYLHEAGHMGDKINFKLGFPFPKAWSYQSRLQYGGLVVNALLFLGIWYFKIENIFIQTIGLIAWLHFIWYTIWGSFNYEPKVPRWMWEWWVFDDIDNEHWFIAVPVAIAAFWVLKDFYIQVAITLLEMI